MDEITALTFGDPESIRLRDSARSTQIGKPMSANSPTSSHWRQHARNIIREIIRTRGNDSDAAIRQRIKDAYPFGMRKYTPYKIWLQEIQLQCDYYRMGK